MRCPTRCAPLAALLAVVCGQAALAQDGDSAGQRPERCIALPKLEWTDVVDDRTLIFHMRDGAVYLNHLQRECPGLKREQLFMYSPTSTELCAVDGVTVIEKQPFGFTRGYTCALGDFNPLTEIEYESLVPQIKHDTGQKKASARAKRGKPKEGRAPSDNAPTPTPNDTVAPTLR